MISAAIRKLAKTNGLNLTSRFAYGNLRGFGAIMYDGRGTRNIEIMTRFSDSAQQEAFWKTTQEEDCIHKYKLQNLCQTNGGVLIVFNDLPGTVKKAETFLDWLIPQLQQIGAAGIGYCTECGLEAADGSWYSIEYSNRQSLVHFLHDSCAEKIRRDIEEERQYRKETDTGSYMRGFLGAILGAVLGAVVWALVLMMGYVVSLVGLLIGWLANKGYNLLRGKQGKGKILILIAVIIFGVVLGTFAAEAIELAKGISSGELPWLSYGDIPGILVDLMRVPEYAGQVTENIVLGLLFAGLGVSVMLWQEAKTISGPKVKKLK